MIDLVPSEKAKILQFLKDRYIEDPCATLSTAFWKILTPFSELSTNFITDNHEIKIITLSNEKRLLLYWQPINAERKLTINLSELNFFVIHERYKKFLEPSIQKSLHNYFRLIHYLQDIPSNYIPKQFHIQNVNFKTDINDICDFLNLCYPHSNFKEESIKNWTKFPAFNPDFWVWIVDDNELKVALGIADIDENVKEISLEWIQVHPQYRNRGLGKALVYELLQRSIGKVSFATVSGSLENETDPERLYRACGFSGSQVWCVYNKREK